MAKDDLVQELDRNMNAVFDNLNILNAAMAAIIQALPAESAAQATRALDCSMDSMAAETNPPGPLARMRLVDWRNLAAQQAGLPPSLPMG